MVRRTELSNTEFIRITTGFWWLITTIPETLSLFTTTTSTQPETEQITEPNEQPQPEPTEKPPTQVTVEQPISPPDITELSITLLMTATYTIRLFDALLSAYPGLRADMEDILEEFAQFIDERARAWTGTGILEPSMIDEESEAGEL